MISSVLDLWPLTVIIGCPLLIFFLHELMDRIHQRHVEEEVRANEAERAAALRARFEIPFSIVYSRADWIRDMENPEVSIEEITLRVSRSNGAWRKPPPPPPAEFMPHPYEGDCSCPSCERIRKRARKACGFSPLGAFVGAAAFSIFGSGIDDGE